MSVEFNFVLLLTAFLGASVCPRDQINPIFMGFPGERRSTFVRRDVMRCRYTYVRKTFLLSHSKNTIQHLFPIPREKVKYYTKTGKV